MSSILLTELIVEHLYNMIQLVFMMSVSGMLVVVCVMVIPTCSYFDPAQALAVDDSQCTA